MAGLTSRNFTIPGGMGPVLAQQRPDGQRARRLAHMLMEQGSESGPVRSHMEGIARAGKAMAGAWMQRQADERAGERSQAYQDTLAEAMRAKGWTDPDTGQVPPGASKTDFMAQILAGNQDTAPMAMNMQLQQDRERQAMAEQLRRDDSARADKQMTTLTPEQMAEHNLPQGSGWEKDAHGGLHSLYDAPEAPSAPTTRRRIEGGELVEEEWRNGAWELLSRGPRWSASERQTGRELTPPQQRSNTKIEHARNWLRQSGLGPDELRQKLGSNTDVLQWLDTQDPVVRQAWSAASQPLYGDDPEYADFWTRFAPAAAPSLDIANPPSAEPPSGPAGMLEPPAPKPASVVEALLAAPQRAAPDGAGGLAMPGMPPKRPAPLTTGPDLFDMPPGGPQSPAAGRPGAGPPAGAAGGLPSPKTQAEFDALPRGAEFIAPDGSRRRKP